MPYPISHQTVYLKYQWTVTQTGTDPPLLRLEPITIHNWLTLLQYKCLPGKQLNKTLNTGFTYYFVILHFTNAW